MMKKVLKKNKKTGKEYKKPKLKYRLRRAFGRERWCPCGDEILEKDTLCWVCRWTRNYELERKQEDTIQND